MAKVDLDDIRSTIREATSGLDDIISTVNELIRDAKKQVDHGNVTTQTTTPQHTASGEYKNQKFMPPQLYKKVSGEETGGKVQSILGGGLALSGALLAVAGVLGTIFGGSKFFLIVLGALALVGGLFLTVDGLKRISRIRRFKKYLDALGDKTYITVQELMEATGKSEKQVESELRELIEQKYFRQGHLDAPRDYFITSDATFRNYEEVLKTQATLYEAEAKRDEVLRESGLSKEGIRLVKQGEQYLAKIQRLNAEIPDAAMTEKLQTMEKLIREILYGVRKNPSSAGDLRKLMNYYLPTTEKLLKSYQELDRQRGSAEAKKTQNEISETLDTMNAAFERMLAKLFRNENWDVNADISVLNQMLEMEGLKDQENQLSVEKRN